MEILASLLVGFAGSVLAAYFVEKCPDMTSRVVKWSASRLPNAAAFERDWLADLEWTNSSIERFMWSLDTIRASILINRDIQRIAWDLVVHVALVPVRVQAKRVNGTANRLNMLIDTMQSDRSIESVEAAARQAMVCLRQTERMEAMGFHVSRLLGSKPGFMSNKASTLCREYTEGLQSLADRMRQHSD